MPLHVGGEVHWPIDPLDLPGTTDDGDAVVQAASVRLFADRAAAARPDFTIDGRNRAVVANICRHLDGLPLSIELAAARLAIQSLTEIQEGISERFQLLRSPDRHVPERHRSVEELLAWSYRSLSDAEQAAFRAVSVFSSGFSISTAVPALSSARIEPNDVAMLVWSLVDRSLVVADLSANETRYRLLETMRSYGRGLLDEHGEMGAVANAVGRAMMNQIGPWFVADRRWMGVVAVELDNLRTLIGHIPTADQELAQQIACTIGRYHDASQTFRDGIEELSRHVDLLPAATPTRVALLTDLAYLHLRTGDVDQARLLVDTAADLLDELGVPEWDDVAVDRTRGELARRSGDFPGAVKIAREALERPLTDRGRSRMFNLLGTSSAALGDMETAYEALNDELVLDKVVGYHGTIAAAQGNLAEVAMRLGDIEAAALHQAACLELGLAQGSTAMVAFSLIVAARIAGGRQDWATATRLHAKGEELLEETGLALYDDDRDRSDELLAEAREALGNETFASLTYRDPQLDLPEALVMAKAVFSATGLETTV